MISSEIKPVNKKVNKFSFFFVMLISIFLNQSGVIFGVNMSVADLLLVFILLYYIFKHKLLFPFNPTIFFIVTSVLVLFSASFYVPYKFNVNADNTKIIVNYVKVFAIFLYFILGYNLARLNLTKIVIKWYSIFALIIGILGSIFTFLKINLFTQIFFFGGFRFKGLMNDPNYFSIVQISALVYFVRLQDNKMLYKIIAIMIFIISILSSGSKTGMITLISYFILITLENFFKNKKNLSRLMLNTVVLMILILLIIFFLNDIPKLVEYINYIIPGFSRVGVLFTDPVEALSGGGSSRDIAWQTGIEIIKLSPMLGIGVGTYTNISQKLFNVGVIAHNTYLQLYAEWGIILSTILFMYIFFIIGKITFNKNFKNNKEVLILRDIIIIFLVGSMAISLNNARMFWLFLGMTVLKMNQYKSNVSFSE